MKIPEWVKPGFWGAAIGAVALAIVGFTWGGWVTAGTAQEMAAEQTRIELVKALVPICIEQSKEDPKRQERLAELEKESSWARSEKLMTIGWATMPGAEKAYPAVADACMEQLAKSFTK